MSENRWIILIIVLFLAVSFVSYLGNKKELGRNLGNGNKEERNIRIKEKKFDIQDQWRRTCLSNLRTINGDIQIYIASKDEAEVDWSALLGDIDSDHPFIPDYLTEPPICPKARAIDGSRIDEIPCYSIHGHDQRDAHAVCNYYGEGGIGADPQKDHILILK